MNKNQTLGLVLFTIGAITGLGLGNIVDKYYDDVAENLKTARFADAGIKLAGNRESCSHEKEELIKYKKQSLERLRKLRRNKLLWRKSFEEMYQSLERNG